MCKCKVVEDLKIFKESIDYNEVKNYVQNKLDKI